MGTNFYWKKLPKELEKFYTPENENILMHIGKRSAAGRYCRDCGVTFHRHGTSYVHSTCDDSLWYDKCPVCGSQGENTCSFTWTCMLQRDILEKYQGNTEKLIVDEYGDGYTPKDFLLSEVLSCCEIEFQAAADFG